MAPTDALDLDRDGCARRATLGREFHRHVQIETGLDEEPAALLQNDVVQEAEILGRHEARDHAAVLIGPHLGDAIGDRFVLAPVIFRIGDLPGSPHRAPDQVEFLLGRQPFRGHDQGRADRAMLGRDRHAADVAARGLLERNFRAELARERRRHSRRLQRTRECQKRQRQPDRKPPGGADRHDDGLQFLISISPGMTAS